MNVGSHYEVNCYIELSTNRAYYALYSVQSEEAILQD